MVYLPSRQWPTRPRNLAVRSRAATSSRAVATVRAALQRAEPGLVP